MRIAATGFVESGAGSIASANALLLKSLLEAGIEVDFFSKSKFVDPRPIVGHLPGFAFEESSNAAIDAFRKRTSPIPGVRFLAERLDVITYNRLLGQRISDRHKERNYSLVLWLGPYAAAECPGLRNLSLVQGAPGSDAFSILKQREEIIGLIGMPKYLRFAMLSKMRLSRFGLPPFEKSQHYIVGSSVSKRQLSERFGVDANKITPLPYAIDLELFHLPKDPPALKPGLKVLWLGRIVPRKRLDVFLKGAELCIRAGGDVHLTIVGGIARVPGYEKMIAAFPFQDRLTWEKKVARPDVPQLMWDHDVLSQPSDNEDFGSSVAEAQACGLPAIVGNTNGNKDYICPRSIHLQDETPETYAAALQELINRKETGRWGSPEVSRATAEQNFSLAHVSRQFIDIVHKVAAN